MKVSLKLWLIWRRLRFLGLPAEKRVRLVLEKDGRYIPFLITSLHEAGFGVHVTGGAMLFRELLAFRRGCPIPFMVGGRETECSISISDVASPPGDSRRSILLDHNFFRGSCDSSRVPYFMHPVAYYNGFHQLPRPDAGEERPVRIGFYGTSDREFYTANFRFPIMNRADVLDVFDSECRHSAWRVSGDPGSWPKRLVAISLDQRGGDVGAKAFLPIDEYMAALERTDFILSPPGWCMPLAHSAIEAMSRGAIPILNSDDWYYPKLRDGVNCLAFNSPDELRVQISRALQMTLPEIVQMRLRVLEYYDQYLRPEAWLRRFLDREGETSLLVNNEEVSVGMADLEFARVYGERQKMAATKETLILCT